LIEAVFLHLSFISTLITLVVVMSVQNAADEHAEFRGVKEKEDAELSGKRQRQLGGEGNLPEEWAGRHRRDAANVFKIERDEFIEFDALSDRSGSVGINEYSLIVDLEYETEDSTTKRKSKQLVLFDTGYPSNFIFRAALSRMGLLKLHTLPAKRTYTSPINPYSTFAPEYFVSVIIRHDKIQLCSPAVTLKVIDVEGYGYDQYRGATIILGRHFVRKHGGEQLLMRVACTEVNLSDLDTAREEDQE
jgi:hypothetical protein